MAVKMCKEPVTELLQFAKQTVRGLNFALDADHGSGDVRKPAFLVQHQNPTSLRAGYEKELFPAVRGQFSETFVQEQRTDKELVSAGLLAEQLGLDLAEGFEHPVCFNEPLIEIVHALSVAFLNCGRIQ